MARATPLLGNSIRNDPKKARHLFALVVREDVFSGASATRRSRQASPTRYALTLCWWLVEAGSSRELEVSLLGVALSSYLSANTLRRMRGIHTFDGMLLFDFSDATLQGRTTRWSHWPATELSRPASLESQDSRKTRMCSGRI